MDLFGIALSGLQAAQAQLNTSANNIANLNTPGYKAQRTRFVSGPTGGAAVAGTSTDSSPGPVGPDEQEGSNVDLAGEMINLTRASILYSANAAVLRMGQKTTGSLLDILDSHKPGS